MAAKYDRPYFDKPYSQRSHIIEMILVMVFAENVLFIALERARYQRIIREKVELVHGTMNNQIYEKIAHRSEREIK